MIASSNERGSRYRQADRAQHVDVEPQIDTGRLQAAMAEQIANGFDANTTAQQSHGECMSQRIARRSVNRQATVADSRPVLQ